MNYDLEEDVTQFRKEWQKACLEHTRQKNNPGVPVFKKSKEDILFSLIESMSYDIGESADNPPNGYDCKEICYLWRYAQIVLHEDAFGKTHSVPGVVGGWEK